MGTDGYIPGGCDSHHLTAYGQALDTDSSAQQQQVNNDLLTAAFWFDMGIDDSSCLPARFGGTIGADDAMPPHDSVSFLANSPTYVVPVTHPFLFACMHSSTWCVCARQAPVCRIAHALVRAAPLLRRYWNLPLCDRVHDTLGHETYGMGACDTTMDLPHSSVCVVPDMKSRSTSLPNGMDSSGGLVTAHHKWQHFNGFADDMHLVDVTGCSIEDMIPLSLGAFPPTDSNVCRPRVVGPVAATGCGDAAFTSPKTADSFFPIDLPGKQVASGIRMDSLPGIDRKCDISGHPAVALEPETPTRMDFTQPAMLHQPPIVCGGMGEAASGDNEESVGWSLLPEDELDERFDCKVRLPFSPWLTSSFRLDFAFLSF